MDFRMESPVQWAIKDRQGRREQRDAKVCRTYFVDNKFSDKQSVAISTFVFFQVTKDHWAHPVDLSPCLGHKQHLVSTKHWK